jgi:hypothetical protein
MSTGRIFIVIGTVFIILGGISIIGEKFGGGHLTFGRLPGDIAIKGEHSSFYFPITTCIVLSLTLSAILWLIRYFRG